LFSKNAEIAILGVKFNAELSKPFLAGMEKPVVEDETIGAVFHQLRCASGFLVAGGSVAAGGSAV
jgi:hypothetical protein